MYDANGQLTSDGFHTYEWNADGNLGQLDGGTGTQITNYYDALGRRVEQVPVSGSTLQMVWDPLGWRRATGSGQTFTSASLILPGGSLAFYNGSGLNAIRHADWLGSMRFTTAANGTYLGSGALAPYGEEYAVSASAQLTFENQRGLLAGDLWDFPARELHSTQGRWISPDPAGLSAVDITDPQTWNRYSFVRNTPTSLVDPDGLFQDACRPYGVDPSTGKCRQPPVTIPPPPDLCALYGICQNQGTGGTSTGGGGGAPQTQQKHEVCGNTGLGLGFGFFGTGNADLGVGYTGASVNGSVGGGAFYDSATGLSAGAFRSGGAMAVFGSHVAGAPAQAANDSMTAGAFAGIGGGFFFTNARSVQQLKGPFGTLNFNVGYSFAQLQIQFASSNGTWVVSVSPPLAGAAIGASVSTFNTNTRTTRTGCE